jgi:hypothetical protein
LQIEVGDLVVQSAEERRRDTRFRSEFHDTGSSVLQAAESRCTEGLDPIELLREECPDSRFDEILLATDFGFRVDTCRYDKMRSIWNLKGGTGLAEA